MREKGEQITDQSLESTRRMAKILHEAKEAGIRSLVLIDEQGEQLDRIEDDMNQIKEDMEDAEKNLEGLQKCCGLCVLPWKSPQIFSRGGEYGNTWRLSEDGKLNSDRRRVAAGRETGSKGPIITRITNDEREDEMEQNLTSVGDVLGNLREMAIDMGSEIEYQNRQLDRINIKDLTDRICKNSESKQRSDQSLSYNVKHNVYQYHDVSIDVSTDDIITRDRTGSEHVDMEWDIIQRDKDQLINVDNDKNDVITEEINDRKDDRIQAAEESPSISALNLQVMAIVDAQLFRKFLKRNHRDVRQTHNAIITYFSSVFAMVNERFQTMRKFGLDITIKLAAIVIEEREQDVPWLRGHVRRPSYTREAMIDVESVLRDLTKWLQNSSLPNYDHAVAFTGLGAVHDGQSSNSGNCSAEDNYIMAPQHQMNPEKVQNLFHFSHCSSSKILQLIRSNKPQCLYDANPEFPYPYDLDTRPPGQTFTRETQCKLVFGENSTLCFYITPSRSNDDRFCGNVWCQNPDNPKMCQTKARLVTLPGTVCGENKICRMGKCVPKNASRESELCGSAPEDEVYCHRLLQRQGEEACQFAAVRNVCCRTCLGVTGQRGQDTVSK
ncbi:uncharacterized protein LOC134248908 [Saccostrea cucullata]|uniref:uncharacterized protein LOC134248908 n=1 Tax=Saccostrea cuccullata TaxID=36930 RepID=UPI002ED1DF2C